MRTLLLLAFVLPLLAAEPLPRERVLNLVPPASSVCFVVQNLRDQAKTVAASEFAKWASGKLGNALEGNADAQHLKQLEAFLQPFLGITLADLRDDILGDCLAFAYEAGPTGKPDAERGILILHARDEAKLRTLIDKLNAFQKNSGDLKGLKEHTHNGVTYIERDRGNAVGEYYLVRDHIFAFAMHEAEITNLIDRQAKPTPSTVLRDLDALKLQNAFLACWLAPRSLDAQWKATKGDKDETAGAAQMARIWSAVDRCAFYLSAGEGLELGATVTYRSEILPAEVRPGFDAPPRASALWSVIPKDAIAAVAATAEVNAVLDLAGSFLPPEDRPRLRKQIERELGAVVGAKNVDALLGGLGPDCGAWIEKSPLPFPLVTAAVRVKDNVALAKKALGFYVPMIVVDYNRRHDEGVTLTEGDVTVVSNDKLFPAGVAPAYSFKDGFVIFGSSTAAVEKFHAPSLAATGEVAIARISGTAQREHMIQHRDGLAMLIARWKGSDDDAALKKDFDSLATILEAFDSVEAVIRGDTASRTFAVKVKLIKPLK